MVVMLISLTALGWFMDRRRRSHKEWTAVKALQSNAVNRLEFKNDIAVSGTSLEQALGIDLPSPLLAISSLISRDGDAFAQQLTKTPSLQQVRILGSEVITEKGMQSLATLPQLRVLFLSLDKSDGAGLRHFSQSNSLESLHLSSCKDVTEQNIALLAEIPKLRQLSLHQIPMSDALLKTICQIRPLTELDLSETLVTDRHLETLTGHAILTHLNLRDTKITNAGVATLMSLPALRELDVRMNSVTEACIPLFYKHPSLRVVRITGDDPMANVIAATHQAQPDHPLTIALTRPIWTPGR